MKYFAYGSNMSLPRLQQRVPSAIRIGFFTLKSHDLRFHKASKDGSGKCDAFFSGDDSDFVIGALFEICDSEKKALDRAEGLGDGYNEKQVLVVNESGEEIKAVTYYATKIDETLKPYSWYKNHVLHGAKESQLPEQYIRKIIAIESIEDQDKTRDAKERAIYS